MSGFLSIVIAFIKNPDMPWEALIDAIEEYGISPGHTRNELQKAIDTARWYCHWSDRWFSSAFLQMSTDTAQGHHRHDWPYRADREPWRREVSEIKKRATLVLDELDPPF